ncbi:hypothetical protein MTO96_016310 [Rhipicephalus appendiculatus]
MAAITTAAATLTAAMTTAGVSEVASETTALWGDDGAYDGTVMQSVYAPPETIVGPTVVLRRKRRSIGEPAQPIRVQDW